MQTKHKPSSKQACGLFTPRSCWIIIRAVVISILMLSCSPTMLREAREAPRADSAETKTAERGDDHSVDVMDKAKKTDADGTAQESQPTVEAAQKLATQEGLRVKTPQLLARLGSPDLEPLPLMSQDIYVVIVEHKIRVVVDLVFYNPSERIVAGNLMIALPNGASPCYLGMFQGSGITDGQVAKADTALVEGLRKKGQFINPQTVGSGVLLAKEIILPQSYDNQGMILDWGQLRSAKVVNPVAGREIYESVTRQRIDPALAEWAGSGKFSTRIFPINAGACKRVVFAYDRALSFAEGRVVQLLPLPDSLEAPVRVTIIDRSRNLTKRAVLLGTEKISARTINKEEVWQVYPPQDFTQSLIFTAETVNKAISVLVGEDPVVSGKLVQVRITPALTADEKQLPTGRAVFLLDTSYSGKDKLFSLAGKMLASILENDKSITEFAVIAFDVRSRLLTSGMVSNNSENRQALLNSVSGIWLEGATNLISALRMINSSDELMRADTVFLLSDGEITWGVDVPRTLAGGFAKLLAKRWICYAFGDNPLNRPLFQVLTRANGMIVNTQVGDDLKVAAMAHSKKASNLEAVYTEDQDEVIVSGSPAQVYRGQSLDIAIRVLGDKEKAVLHVRIDGKVQSFTVNLETNPLAKTVAARAWAEIFTNSVLDLYDKSTEELVLALSQAFVLSNRLASFIILETDSEYVQYKITDKNISIADLAQAAYAKGKDFDFAAPDLSGLSAESLGFIKNLQKYDAGFVYSLPTVQEMESSSKTLQAQPKGSRGNNTPKDLYLWAKEIYAHGDGLSKDQALRILSTIVEEKPTDDQSLRLVGYVLLEWGMFGEAEGLFTRVLLRRPFEPQNYLLEALALFAQGKNSEAVLRLEIVLQLDFPRFDSYVKPVAERMYIDYLKYLSRQGGLKDADKTLVTAKMAAIGFAKRDPAGRIFLFWNLDDTDVDLHIVEKPKYHISYENMKSPSGGQLFWDNTTGLGPEMYEHPQLHEEGFAVFVHYFGSSSIEGQAPAATLVAAFTSSGTQYNLRFYSTVLVNVQVDQVDIMPLWRP